ncbi:MAG: n-acetylglutamate synthase [Ferruginibacter sp.]|uniref:hypothetical protein n=1 Tax=Ferruginibacter sp. TaxID=1940288 RepID=UPI00265AA02D|nr:hypothetical protein [Ferruginibacter sp.]MDB5279556.1 n-acetylglutamate synthase [Ferruginibacter sp.]
MINYNGKIFSPIVNNTGSDYWTEALFVFRQTGNILTSNYSGGNIVRGQMLAIVDDDGSMKMCYHHVTTDLVLFAGSGECHPEILPNGKIVLLQKWKSATSDMAGGNLIIGEH